MGKLPRHVEGQQLLRRGPRHETDADATERARGLAAPAMKKLGVWHDADGVVLERRGLTLFVHLEWRRNALRYRTTVDMRTNAVTVSTL